MMKKHEKTVGPKSSSIIKNIVERGNEVFTLEEACEIYKKGKQETSGFLRDLINRKLIARVKPGVFLILKTGYESTQLRNWPLIARALVGNNTYYISHYSAMLLHGMTTHPLNHVRLG